MAAQSRITLICNFAGENNDVTPRLCRLYCPDNTLAQIAVAGFLDNYLQSSVQQLLPTDFVAVVGSDGSNWYKPVVTNGSVNLNTLP